MKRSLFIALFCAACVGGSAASSVSYVSGDAGCADDGIPETWSHDVEWYGESDYVTPPIMLGRWEYLGKDRVLKIGEGQSSGSNYKALEVLQLDANDKIAFMTDGRQRIKLQDHPTGILLHLSEVPNLWFGNTIREDVNLQYQGASGGDDLAGYHFLIQGQSASGNPSATSVTGGDLEVAAGDASSTSSAVPDAGELLLRGGKVGNTTEGNVALHDEPSTWGSMQGGLYVHNVETAPSASPTGGGYLYADGGELYWRGSSGTVTKLADD